MLEKLIGSCALCVLLNGCTSKVTQQTEYTGFLDDYNGLKKIHTPSGGVAMRWVSPGWNSDTYETVMFSGLDLFFQSKHNDRVSPETFLALQADMNQSLVQVLGKRYKFVSSIQEWPVASKTLIVRAAITDVSVHNEGMHWYEVVPIAGLVGAVSAVTGHRDQDTELYFEAEIIDSSNGKTMAKVVRKVFGDQLQNAKQSVIASDFKHAIQSVAVDMQLFIHSNSAY